MASSDRPLPAMPSTPGDVPGQPVKMGTAMLAKGAELLQSFRPINNIQLHFQNFLFLAHDMNRQLALHYYGGHVNEEVIQCLLYDSDEADARLVGAAYLISERLFAALPDEEKKLWHTLDYAVKSGQLIMPGAIQAAERSTLQSLATMYGKAWLFWQYDRGDRLPMGPPALLEAFTDAGQLRLELLDARDAKYGIKTADKVVDRVNIEGLKTADPLANHWKKGKGLATELKQVDVSLPPPNPLSKLQGA